MNAPTYESGAACLFSMAARGTTEAPPPKLSDPVTCPNCLSDETKSVEQEHGIFEFVTAARRSLIRTVDNPLARIGSDRLLLDDVTRFGLHRQVIARRDEPPDAAVYLAAIRQKSPEADVSHVLFEKDSFFFLWMWWKEPKV